MTPLKAVVLAALVQVDPRTGHVTKAYQEVNVFVKATKS